MAGGFLDSKWNSLFLIRLGRLACLPQAGRILAGSSGGPKDDQEDGKTHNWPQVA